MEFAYGVDVQNKRERKVQCLKAQEPGNMEILESKGTRLDKESLRKTSRFLQGDVKVRC